MRKLSFYNSNTAARLFALAALLFVLGAQIIESGHAHTDSDTVSSCVLCQVSSGAALPSSPTTIATLGAACLLIVAAVQATPVRRATLFQPRGPPHNS